MSTTKLVIGRDGFSLPISLVTSTQAILARKRSGKSYTASVQAEEMLGHNQQIAVIDPTGAWWGIRSSADGKEAGLQVVVFGGDHADAPLDHTAGKAMAAALVEHGFSAIFDIGNLETSKQLRFVMDFCAELLRINRTAMHLFIDEADTFAPQKTASTLQFECLGTVTRLVSQGGIRGVGVTMITQRSAKINWDVLSQVDILTVLRMGAPNDVKPVVEWLQSETSKEFAAQVRAALPSLPVGTAFIASAPLELAERVAVRERRTFNSGATPKPGERKIVPKVLATIDIQKLGLQIAESVKVAKENSPEFLKAQLAEAQQKIRELEAAPPTQNMSDEEMRMLGKELERISAQVTELEKSAASFLVMRDEATKLVQQLAQVLNAEGPQVDTAEIREFVAKAAESIAERPSSAAVATPIAVPRPVTDASVSKPQGKILEALGSGLSIRREQLPRTVVAFLAGASAKSSAFSNNLGALRSAGLIDYRNGEVFLTPAGRKIVPPQPPLSEAELHARLASLLPDPQMRILRALIPLRGRSLGRDVVASKAGASPTSSAYSNNLGALRTLGFIDYGPDRTVFGTSDLFITEARNG